MGINWNKNFRKLHYWGAIIILPPAFVIITTGLILQLKKNIDWIQPITNKGTKINDPSISFDDILAISKKALEAEIDDWGDIERLDVRLNKGLVKVKAKNNWEIQIDTYNGNIIQVDYRRSDIIENLHDGSWFHKNVKNWIFFPSGIILLVLWLTGFYMIVLPYKNKLKKNNRN